MAKREGTKVVTNKCRVSYPWLFKAQPAQEVGQEPKYGVSIIIPKSDTETIKLLREAEREAIQAKWGDKPPKFTKKFIKDGDEEKPEDEAYKDSYYITARSKNPPGVVKPVHGAAEGQPKVVKIDNADEVYAGCWGAFAVNVFAYNQPTSKGISAGLNNFVKLAEGERLAGSASAENDFGDMDFSAYQASGDDIM